MNENGHRHPTYCILLVPQRLQKRLVEVTHRVGQSQSTASGMYVHAAFSRLMAYSPSGQAYTDMATHNIVDGTGVLIPLSASNRIALRSAVGQYWYSLHHVTTRMSRIFETRSATRSAFSLVKLIFMCQVRCQPHQSRGKSC
jgi:hypothetical protein